MKNITVFLSLATLLLAGCSVQELEKNQDNAGMFPTFYASFDDNAEADTKTYVDDKMKLRWTEDDRLSIFVGNTYNHEYKYDGETGANNGSFSAVSAPGFVAGETLGANYAVYPYNASHEMDPEDGLSVILPSVQNYAEDSFGLGSNTMVAVTEDKNDMLLQFKNLCGYVVVKLYGEGTVKSLKLEGNDGEKISGKASVQTVYGELPSVSMSEEATTSITLDCGEGVTLGTTAETATEFWFCVPPVTFSKGFTVTATKADGWQMVKSTSSSKEVVRNTKNALAPIEAVFDKEPDNSQTLALEREALIAIYNALDGDNWNNNANWCSDKPVGEWYGVSVNTLGEVYDIDLSVNNLAGVIPDCIGNFVGLTTLKFDNNYNLLGPLPEKIGSCESLRYINITGTGITEIPQTIFCLSNLRSLDAESSSLKITENVSKWEKLERLLCKVEGAIDNHLFSDCSKLEWLALRGENILIPEEISNLKDLVILDIRGCVGQIPNSIASLQKLISLSLYGNLTGSIPEEICEMNLEELFLDGNQLTGSIPENIGNSSIVRLGLGNNHLTGTVPASVTKIWERSNPHWDCNFCLINNNITQVSDEVINHPLWCRGWFNTIYGNMIDYSKIVKPGPDLSGQDINGNEITTDYYYGNTYTILTKYPSYLAEFTNINVPIPKIKEWYSRYKDAGLGILMCGEPADTKERLQSFVSNYDIPWTVCSCTPGQENNLEINGADEINSSLYYVPVFMIVDKLGNIVFYDALEGLLDTSEKIDVFLEKNLGENDFGLYKSVDYSADGKVVSLHTASEGYGINVVLMGDGYSDRQIADGTYAADMKSVYDNLFNEEPYSTYKDMFNVSYVNVVSQNEGYQFGSSTAINCYFGGGTLVGGNDNVAFSYALESVSEDKIDNTLIIVVMNSDTYAGTCYLYYPIDTYADYGNGASVAYFPKGSETDTFAQLLHHEACGHGFAKLADEYAYEYMGMVPDDYSSQIKSQQNSWGWYRNIDFTSNPAQVKWSKFLSDERYANEGLGCFEGGLTYWSGVWRPTDNSIMRYNTGGFNAPSREAIWYRIHKLAYGEEWQYNYEDFVAYDAINRTPAAQAASRAKVAKAAAARNGKPFQPLHEPVIVKRSWKDAVNNVGINNGR